MTKLDESWWRLAERRGISREVWDLLAAETLPPEARLGEGVRPPEWAGGLLRNVFLPDEIWGRMILPMAPYVRDQDAVWAPHLSEGAPGLAIFAEILVRPFDRPLRDRVAELIKWYDYKSRNEYPISKLRETIKRQLKLVSNLIDKLPEERESGSFFSQNIFSYSGEIFKSNLRPNDSIQRELSTLWNEQFGTDQLKLSLTVYKNNLSRTLDVLPNTRPPITAIDELIWGLAQIWHEYTGTLPKGGNRNMPDGTKFGGAFSEFVRAVIKEIGPPEPSLDRPLKKVVSRMNSERKKAS